MKAAIVVALGAFLILGLVLGTRGPAVEPSSTTPTPPPDAVILSPPAGYRRALDSEITASMRAAALAALALPLGRFVYYDGFAIGVESHWDQARGWHKGASVFVPKGAT